MPIYTATEKAAELRHIERHFEYLSACTAPDDVRHWNGFLLGFVTALLRTGALTEVEHDDLTLRITTAGIRRRAELEDE